MLKSKKINMIEVKDWDNLVVQTYDKPYCFQQQDGCQPRGVFHLTVPSLYTNDEEMHDFIPDEVNGESMGVKFKVWLERDPDVHNFKYDWENDLFWDRNFYPDIYTVANDLYEKGLIDEGEYVININW